METAVMDDMAEQGTQRNRLSCKLHVSMMKKVTSSIVDCSRLSVNIAPEYDVDKLMNLKYCSHCPLQAAPVCSFIPDGSDYMASAVLLKHELIGHGEYGVVYKGNVPERSLRSYLPPFFCFGFSGCKLSLLDDCRCRCGRRRRVPGRDQRAQIAGK